MSSWPVLEASLNANLQQKFGEPVVYQSVVGGMGQGDPQTIIVVRRERVREEAGLFANLEEIDVNPKDLAVPPERGDWVTAWGTQFVVMTKRQPDPNGMITLALMVRAGQTVSTP
jgi:hypothetical protein